MEEDDDKHGALSRPVQFIPNLDSPEHRRFVECWVGESSIIAMMREFDAARVTIHNHAARSGLPPRAGRKIPQRACDIPPGSVVKKAKQIELLVVRCTTCNGQYRANVDEVEVCPMCGQPRGPARRRVLAHA